MALAEQAYEIRLKPPLPWQRKLEAAYRSDARFVLAVMGRRAGKTTGLGRIAGRCALESQPILWGAPTHDLASIGRKKILEQWRPTITRTTQSPADVDFVGGGSILFRSFERPGASIGRKFRLAVVDEAARVKRQPIYEDLLPALADLGGKMIAITTPRGRTGWVWDWYQRAMAGDPLYAVIHGPTSDNPDRNIQDFVEIARANMPESLFRQEILAEFVEGEGQVFRRIAEAACLPSYRDAAVGDYAIGCDVAKHQDYTVLYAVHTETGEVHACDRFNQLDWTLIEQRISDFAARWPGIIWLDSTGVGDGVFDRLNARGLPVQPFKFSSDSKQNLVIALCNALEKGEVKFPADPVLIGELESFAYEELPSGRFRYSAPEGMHDDCVMALALAVWGRAQYSPVVMGWV